MRGGMVVQLDLPLVVVVGRHTRRKYWEYTCACLLLQDDTGCCGGCSTAKVLPELNW